MSHTSQLSAPVSRRGALKLAGGLALAAAATSALAPLAGPTEARADAAEERTLRVALSGSSTDSLDPAASNALHLPYAVKFNTMDCLANLEGTEIVKYLATDFTCNEDATEWTITIRDDATFHDGTPVTADDVLYSLTYIGTSAVGMMSYQNVDFEASTSDGAQTVTLKLTTPQATLVEEALSILSFIFPAGTVSEDFASDLGSGPYCLESFNADSGAVLVANENYWGGAPAIKRIELVPIADAATRATALTSGQVDFADGVSATDADVIEAGGQFTVAPGSCANSSAFKFCLNATCAPFDDPEVRLAFKQIVDRQTMVDTLFRGKGEVGNDVVGKGLPTYCETLEQREMDFDAAAAVFADKGVSELEVLTSEMVPGIKDSVDMLAQQMGKAGVTLNVTEVDPSTLFTTDVAKIYSTQVFATYLINRPYAATALLYTYGSSPYNFSQWADADYDALIDEFAATADETARQEVLDEAQAKIWADGAECVWGYSYDLTAAVPELSGVGTTQSVPLFAKATFA